MRNNYRFMLGLAAIAIASGIAPNIAIQQVEEKTGLDFEKARRHRGKGQNNRRGKGHSAPKKRSNRLTISKRVRRAHRRSAKA